MTRLRLIPLLVCVLISADLCLQAQQDGLKTSTDEEDARVATVVDRQNAVADLLKAGEEFETAGDEMKAARAWNRAGRFQLLLNKPDDAIGTYRKSLSVLGTKPDPHSRVDSLNGLASAYRTLSQYAAAQSLLRQSIALSEKTSYLEGKAEAHLILPYCQNDMALALEMAQKSLELWQSINNKLGLARAYVVLGEFQMIQYQLSESANSYQSALQLWKELNVPTQMAEALINLGFIEYHKGAWQSSLSFYIQAQQLIPDEAAEPYMMGQITAGLAEAFIESGMPELGLVKYRESLEYHRLTNDPLARIGTEWGIGRTHYFLGHYPEALAILKQSQAEATSIKYLMISGLSDDFLGRTYYAMNDYPAALRHYHAALDELTRSNNPVEAARIVALMGQVYQQQGKLDVANKQYLNALASFRRLADQVNESATLYALGTLELQRSSVDAAEEYLRDSIKLTETMLQVSRSSDLSAAFSAKVHERYEKFIECKMRKYRASQVTSFAIDGFLTSERSRARSLSELLRATQANMFPGLDPELARREKELREYLQLNEEAKLSLLRTKYKTEDLKTLEAKHQQLEAEHNQLLQQIRSINPAFEQIIEPTNWDLAKIQQQVVADDDTVLLEFSLGSEKSYLWAVTRSEIKSYELPDEQQIRETSETVYNLLKQLPSERTDNQLSTATQKLAETVLFPAREQLNHRRVIVVPDGPLNYIPFQILPSPVNNEPLVASQQIVNAPSASILGELQQEATHRQPASNLLAAFGDPVFATESAQSNNQDNNDQAMLATARLRSALRDVELNGESFDPSALTRLFHARRELDSLRDVAGEQALIVSDYAATRDRFLNTDLTRFAILHLVTHGYFNPKHPENSGFVLSTINDQNKHFEGFVGLKEIYELRAPVLLVVLSACQTALGKDVRGEGLMGLTRGFMHAGASSVVASLWEVDDRATAELMKLFYGNMLQRGMTPGEALGAAQNTIRQQPKWRSPYYWAAFTLQGEYRQVIKPVAAPQTVALQWKIAIGIALLLLFSILAIRYRRKTKLSR